MFPQTILSCLPSPSVFTTTVFVLLFGAVQLQPETCNYLSHLCPLNLFNGMAIHPNYATLNTTQLIMMFGYPAEEHFVITEDNYVLSVQRIPFSSKSPSSQRKVPVFLMHGTFASSAQWLWQPPNRALVFMLADAGYDVWLGNARGTSYSRGYVGPSPASYWDFSFNEIGTYDLPAFINYIQNATEQPSLYYIGHSLGTTEVFVLASLRPEMQSSIRTFFALAPALYVGNTTSTFFRLVGLTFSQYLAEKTAVLLTSGPVLPETVQKHLVDVTTYCAISAVECTACAIGLLAAFGINPCQTNWTSLPGFLAHLPDAVSGRTLSHIAQLVQFGTFRQYDYGPFHNLFKYGSFTPPDYNLSLFKIPSVFITSDTEDVITPKDVQKTSAAIGSALKETIKVKFKPFTHLDHVTATDGDRLIYNRIIEIMDEALYG